MGLSERQRPAYSGFSNAIVCVSYSQRPIMAEEKRSQESGSLREKTQGERGKRLWSAFLSPLGLSPSIIVATLSHRIANPRSATPQKVLSVACYHSKKHQPFPPSKKTYCKSSVPEKCYPTNRTIGSLLSMLITKT